MKEITQEELKKIQLGILDKVHAFCEEHKLRYSLSSGTLIGAVRHKGYIPWDDDLDIYMPRPDYDRFIKLFPENSPKNTNLLALETCDGYFQAFIKIEDLRTEIVEEVNNSCRMGVNIDVFPVDGVPENNFFRQIFFLWINILRRTLEVKQIKLAPTRSALKNAILLFGRSLVCFFPIKFVLGVLNRSARLFPFAQASDVCNLVLGIGIKGCFKKTVMTSYIKLPFEGNSYFVMSGYDAYLRATYGDYMQLPPPEKRVTHHAFKAYWKE